MQIFSIFLPSAIWHLGQHLSPEQLALYALATFGLTLLAPAIVRSYGERGALTPPVGGLALVRLSIQLARPPLANLLLATAGLGLLGWFIPLSRYPVLAWDNIHYKHRTTEVRGLLRAVIGVPGGPVTL